VTVSLPGPGTSFGSIDLYTPTGEGLIAVVGDIEQFVIPLVRGVAMEGHWNRSRRAGGLGKTDPESERRRPNRRRISLRPTVANGALRSALPPLPFLWCEPCTKHSGSRSCVPQNQLPTQTFLQPLQWQKSRPVHEGWPTRKCLNLRIGAEEGT
jgi:hypothetical protein